MWLSFVNKKNSMYIVAGLMDGETEKSSRSGEGRVFRDAKISQAII